MVFARFNYFVFSFLLILPFTKTREKLTTRATGSSLASSVLRSEPRDPAAPSVQLARPRSPRAASSCHVCKTAQAPFSPMAPAAPFLQPPSYELPAAPSVQLHLRSLSSQLAEFSSCAVAALSFQLHPRSSASFQLATTFQLPAPAFQLARAWKARERGRWAGADGPPVGAPGRRPPGRGLPHFLCVL